jgi:hypothetical protein
MIPGIYFRRYTKDMYQYLLVESIEYSNKELPLSNDLHVCWWGHFPYYKQLQVYLKDLPSDVVPYNPITRALFEV